MVLLCLRALEGDAGLQVGLHLDLYYGSSGASLVSVFVSAYLPLSSVSPVAQLTEIRGRYLGQNKS